jgi:hypothetical protein
MPKVERIADPDSDKRADATKRAEVARKEFAEAKAALMDEAAKSLFAKIDGAKADAGRQHPAPGADSTAAEKIVAATRRQQAEASGIVAARADIAKTYGLSAAEVESLGTTKKK